MVRRRVLPQPLIVLIFVGKWLFTIVKRFRTQCVTENLVNRVARALWHPSTEALLDAGHPQGRHIRRETALDGIGIPLHPGAARYYKERGFAM